MQRDEAEEMMKKRKYEPAQEFNTGLRRRTIVMTQMMPED
jgi:hypothetical protein